MKTFQKLLLFTTMLVLLSAIPSMAQMDNGVTFETQFAFYAGNAKMPAGSYKVTQPDANSDLLLIESPNGAYSVFVDFVPVQSETPASNTDVTFNKYGKTDFLNGISLQGQNFGIQIVASKAEQNAAKAAAAEKHTLSAKNGR